VEELDEHDRVIARSCYCEHCRRWYTPATTLTDDD
jgi:hypothetical protein